MSAAALRSLARLCPADCAAGKPCSPRLAVSASSSRTTPRAVAAPSRSGPAGGPPRRPALGGRALELAQDAGGGPGAAARRPWGGAAGALREPRPVARELADGGVELAQRAVLGGVEAVLAQRNRPGSQSGSSPAFAARERMKSRSESRLR